MKYPIQAKEKNWKNKEGIQGLGDTLRQTNTHSTGISEGKEIKVKDIENSFQ